MKPKFQIGDKARPNRRVPLWAWNELCRHRTRTIISIGYDEAQQHILYELGIQGNGGFPYLFRAWQLTLVTNKTKHTIGRPRQKRRYRRQTMKPNTIPHLALGWDIPCPKCNTMMELTITCEADSNLDIYICPSCKFGDTILELHSKILSNPLEQQLPLLTPKQVSAYLETPDLHYRGLLDLQHI